MATKRRYYGIKFPFTCNNLDEHFLDLNEEIEGKVASDIIHVLLTPKRTRIHMPDFGTDIIKYVFEQNDQNTWGDIEKEAKTCVARYVNNVDVTKIEVVSTDNDREKILHVIYRVVQGNKSTDNELVVRI